MQYEDFFVYVLLRAAQLFVKIELIVKCPLQHSAIMTKAFHSFIHSFQRGGAESVTFVCDAQYIVTI